MYIENKEDAITNHSNMVTRYMNRFGTEELAFLGIEEDIVPAKRCALSKSDIKNKEIKTIKISPKSLNLDGEKLVKTLAKKIKKNEKLTDEEIVRLVYSGYCSPYSKTKLVYEKAVKILNESHLTPEELETVEYHMCLLYSRSVNSERYKKMNEIFKNGYPAYKKGMESLELGAAQKLLDRGHSPENVSELVKMPLGIIKSLDKSESSVELFPEKILHALNRKLKDNI